jgi:glycosyltransferase involved in cell wall biosynthesis
MKILAIAPKPLLPIRGGMELRVYNLLMPLSLRHEISLICFSSEKTQAEESIDSLREHFRVVKLIPLVQAETEEPVLSERLKNWFSPPPDLLGNRTAAADMKNAIDSFLDEKEIELVHFACADMISYLLDVTRVPIVFDSIDDPSLHLQRSMSERKRLVDKARALKDWLVMRKFEKRYFSKFREIVVSSPIDAKVISSFCPDTNVTVISNGVDWKFFQTVADGTEEPVLIFTGVMDYSPNVSAMVDFCKSIFPLIRRQIPDAQLLIVGRNPSSEILSLEKKSGGISVTGSVVDIRPYMSRAKVFICPLKSGAGIKNKILEAWASGKPVVATSLSCEGIDVSQGKDVVIADSISDFADSVVRLLQNRDMRERIAQKGKEKVKEEYSWGSKADMLEKVYERAIRSFKC